MAGLEQLEHEVENLSSKDLAKFREWFIEFDWALWDTKIADNLKAGKLDQLISAARADFKGGTAREL